MQTQAYHLSFLQEWCLGSAISSWNPSLVSQASSEAAIEGTHNLKTHHVQCMTTTASALHHDSNGPQVRTDHLTSSEELLASCWVEEGSSFCSVLLESMLCNYKPNTVREPARKNSN